MKKIGVLLSGCGVLDGAEIQESVFALLAIEELKAQAVCISIDQDQYHVMNHLTGETMPEKRNMLVESARIARGKIRNIKEISVDELDIIVIPGGFGSAKNFTQWAFEGATTNIIPEIKSFILDMVEKRKPICALCVSPVVVGKALEDSLHKPTMTLGHVVGASDYDISAFQEGLRQTGMQTVNKSAQEIHVDETYRIVSAPCYMMDVSLLQVRENIKLAIEAALELLD